jgi:uncharacterized small protein (DUF1192 family)
MSASQRINALERELGRSKAQLGMSPTRSVLEDSLDIERNQIQSRGSSRGGNVGVYTSSRRESPGKGLTDHDKDATIRQLREEIHRLKTKVNTIVRSAEESLEEAIVSQENMKKDTHAQVAREQQKYQHLVAENAALKEVILSLNEELIAERQHVDKAMRFMERMRGSGQGGSVDKLQALLSMNSSHPFG